MSSAALQTIIPSTVLSEHTVQLAFQVQRMGFSQRQIFSGRIWADHQSPRFEADELAMAVIRVILDASSVDEVAQFLMVIPSAVKALEEAMEEHVISDANLIAGRQCMSAVYQGACLQLITSVRADLEGMSK